MTNEQMDKLVDRFLAWPMPDSVSSDLCATERDYGKAQGYPKRCGTNLLTAIEARQMLEHVLCDMALRSEVQPVAWQEIGPNGEVIGLSEERDLTSPFGWKPLYASPPPQPAPEVGELVRALNIISDGDAPYHNLPSEIGETCCQAASALAARRVSEEALKSARYIDKLAGDSAELAKEHAPIVARELLRIAGGGHG